MSMPPTTTPTGPTGSASIAGLPATAHEVLHRELLHIHSSLHLILLILRGPLDSVTSSIVDTITCPRLSATLRALETSIEQIRRSTCTTLVYTDELYSILGLPHPTGRSTILFYSPFFTSAPSVSLSVSSFSTWDNDEDYDHGSLSSSRPSFYSFGSTFDLDEAAKFSFTFSLTLSSSTLPTLADFSPCEPFSAAKVLHAQCFLVSLLD